MANKLTAEQFCLSKKIDPITVYKLDLLEMLDEYHNLKLKEMDINLGGFEIAPKSVELDLNRMGQGVPMELNDRTEKRAIQRTSNVPLSQR